MVPTVAMAKLLPRSKSLRFRSTRNVPDQQQQQHQEQKRNKQQDFHANGMMKHGLQRPSTSSNGTQMMENYSAAGFDRPRTASESIVTFNRRKWDELTTMGIPIIITADDDTFRFPIPVQRSNASAMAASPATTLTPTTLVQSPSVWSDSTKEYGEIGIALGSPSRNSSLSRSCASASLNHALNIPHQDEISPLCSPPMRSNTTKEFKNYEMDGARPKLSRWRSLGGFFGRKRAGLPNGRLPGSDSNNAVTWETSIDAKINEALNSAGSSEVLGANPISLGQPLRRATLRKTKRAEKSTPTLSELKDGCWSPVEQRSPVPPPKGPMLNVQIPEDRMERYSVMFREVLPKQSSSLLARRQAQANVDKHPLPGGSLKALEIPESSGKLVRRATEPSPCASPAYTLFPYGSQKQHQQVSDNESNNSTPLLYRPRILRRSRTAPGSLSPLPSPIEPEPTTSHTEDGSVGSELLIADEDDSGHAVTPTPSTPSSPRTPKSLSSNELLGRTQTDSWRPTSHDPSWEMITIGKHAEPGDLISDGGNGDCHSIQRSSTGAVDNGDEDWTFHAPAEVAVARTLSVTRARRQLFLRAPPLGGKNEKLVQRKVLTPVVVRDLDTCNRKSVRVLIEHA